MKSYHLRHVGCNSFHHFKIFVEFHLPLMIMSTQCSELLYHFVHYFCLIIQGLPYLISQILVSTLNILPWLINLRQNIDNLLIAENASFYTPPLTFTSLLSLISQCPFFIVKLNLDSLIYNPLIAPLCHTQELSLDFLFMINEVNYLFFTILLIIVYTCPMLQVSSIIVLKHQN